MTSSLILFHGPIFDSQGCCTSSILRAEVGLIAIKPEEAITALARRKGSKSLWTGVSVEIDCAYATQLLVVIIYCGTCAITLDTRAVVILA